MAGTTLVVLLDTLSRKRARSSLHQLRGVRNTSAGRDLFEGASQGTEESRSEENVGVRHRRSLLGARALPWALVTASPGACVFLGRINCCLTVYSGVWRAVAAAPRLCCRCTGTAWAGCRSRMCSTTELECLAVEQPCVFWGSRAVVFVREYAEGHSESD